MITEGNISNSTSSCFISSRLPVVLSVVILVPTMIISSLHILGHLRFYSKPSEQKWVVRLLLTVPIYSCSSIISLTMIRSEGYIYVLALRDIYEAFLIYCFMSLCFTYLGGEASVLAFLNSQVIESSYLLCTCCIAGRLFTISHLRFCKRATLQFCVIKPIVSVVIIVLQSKSVLHDGDFNPKYGYLYVSIVYNISYTLALYGLFFFYSMAKNYLSAYSPLTKFITIKIIMILSYWQYLLFSLLVRVEVINPCDDLADAAYTNGIIFLCISFEMTFVALLMRMAFPYLPYRRAVYSNYETSVNYGGVCGSLAHVFNPRDFFRDALYNFGIPYNKYPSMDDSGAINSEQFAAAPVDNRSYATPYSMYTI